MPFKNEQIARLITVRYWIALGLIALMVSASFLFLDRAIDVQRHRFEVVEVAAKQRMSSQRIGLLANMLVNATDDESRRTYRRALRRIVTQMERRNDFLSLRSEPRPMPSGMRTILQDIYHGGLNPFAAHVRSLLGNARVLLETEDAGLHAELPALLRINIGADRVLQTHELVVRLLRMKAIEAARRIQSFDALLWILTLMLLAAEVPLIFRPMAEQASRTLQRTEALRRKAQSEAAAAEASREGQASFIRTMSHELRTPLNAILGMAQLLRMGGLSPKQDEYASDIQQAGESLLDLINGILEFSRLEAKQVIIDKTETRLEDELARTISMFRPLAEKKALDLGCRVDPRLAESYWADGARIRQILVNLVGNAVKFTDSGSVSVRAAFAGQTGTGADIVRFQVEDTGIGVPAANRDRIFEEFQQADSSLARKYGGSGLGLAISSRLVRLMNGRIGVESAEGEGSVFWFTLPLERMAAEGRPGTAAPQHAGEGKNG